MRTTVTKKSKKSEGEDHRSFLRRSSATSTNRYCTKKFSLAWPTVSKYFRSGHARLVLYDVCLRLLPCLSKCLN